MIPSYNTRPNFEDIIEAKRQALQARRAQRPLEAVRALAGMQARPQPVLSDVTDGKQVLLIGQIKQSLSETGSLSNPYDPVSMALHFMQAGADAVALFTDEIIYNQGLDDLTLLSRAVSLPTICQDYILDEYHAVEARAAGASALVLSAAVLNPDELRTLVSVSERNRMTAIVHVHDEEQMRRTFDISPHVVAIGGQWQELEMLERMRAEIPHFVRIMVIDPLPSVDAVADVVKLGVDAILVGPQVIADPDNALALRSMLKR